MPAHRIPDDIRAGVVEAIAAGGAIRAVAAEFGVSLASARRMADAAGVEWRTDTARTEKAVRAGHVTMAARRAELANLLLEDAHRLRQQLWQPAKVAMTVQVGDGGGSMIVDHKLDEPTFRDKREIITATAIALDKHLKVIQFDGSPELANAKSLLESAFEAAARMFGTGDELVREG